MNLKDKTLNTLLYFKKARKELGLTVAELSAKSEVSVGVISEIEKGKGKVPSLVNFIKLVRTLRIPKDFVLDIVYETPKGKKRTRRNFLRGRRNIKVMLY